MTMENDTTCLVIVIVLRFSSKKSRRIITSHPEFSKKVCMMKEMRLKMITFECFLASSAFPVDSSDCCVWKSEYMIVIKGQQSDQ